MNLDNALEIAFASHPGHVRSHNEDSIACDASAGVAVLADGIGGYHAGEVASAVAVTRVFRETRDGLATLVPGQTDRDSGLHYESLLVADAIRLANEEIFRLAEEQRDFRGMGTTIVAALFFDNQLSCAHAGDSRMYAFTHGRLERLTEDHTVVREFVKTGMYSEDEARASFNPGLITRALGAVRDLEVEIHEKKVRPGDLYLMCSDGLTSMVDEARITKVLASVGDLEECAWELVGLANKRGGEDNTSVVLTRILGEFKAAQDWQTQMIDWFNR